MDQKIFLSALIALTLAACEAPTTTANAPEAAPVQSAEAVNFSNISAQAAKAKLDADDTAIVLDIRTPEEFKDGHIHGAILIDYKSDKFADIVAKLDRSEPYIVHCHSGGRSGRSMDIFKNLGFENVSHMNGGIAEWKKEGLPLAQ